MYCVYNNPQTLGEGDDAEHDKGIDFYGLHQDAVQVYA